MLDINMNLYKVFYKVAQYKSYSDASDKMMISKSAISNYIKKLEEQLNTKLFYRENSGVRLTKEGEELFKYVEKSMELIENGEKNLLQKSNLETGEISVAALSHIAEFYLMPRIEKIKKEHKALNIKLVTASTGEELLRLLENHKVDFILDSTKLDINNSQIVNEKVKDIENIFISKDPIQIKKLKDLEKYDFILGLEYTSTSKRLVRKLKENGVHINSTLEIDITELKISAVKRNLGIGYVMKDSVQKELNNKELYEVKVPMELPKSELRLRYLNGQLGKLDKKFIKDYLLV